MQAGTFQQIQRVIAAIMEMNKLIVQDFEKAFNANANLAKE